MHRLMTTTAASMIVRFRIKVILSSRLEWAVVVAHKVEKWNCAFKKVNQYMNTNNYSYLGHLVVKVLICIYMLVLFNTSVVRHLWQLKTVVFLHWCRHTPCSIDQCF